MAPISLSSVGPPLTATVPPCLLLHRRIFSPSSTTQAASSSSSSSLNPKVVVTRERGKNGKLINALVFTSFRCFSFSHSAISRTLSYYFCYAILRNFLLSFDFFYSYFAFRLVFSILFIFYIYSFFAM